MGCKTKKENTSVSAGITPYESFPKKDGEDFSKKDDKDVIKESMLSWTK